MATFIPDDSIQTTAASVLSTGTNISVFATNTIFHNLSTNSFLNINNLSTIQYYQLII